MVYDADEIVKGTLARRDHGLYSSKQIRKEKIHCTDSSTCKESAPRETACF